MKKITALLLLAIVVSLPASAASDDYRFTHNDHDALIIGQITNIDDAYVYADVSDTVVSTASLNQGGTLLVPQKVQISRDGIWGADAGTLAVDDYIIASINRQAGDVFQCAWGVYRVTGPDAETLEVICDNAPSMAAMYTDFVNSRGAHNDFYGENGSLYRREADGTATLIYSAQATQTQPPETTAPPAARVSATTVPPAGEDKESGGASLVMMLLFFVTFGAIVLLRLLLGRREK